MDITGVTEKITGYRLSSGNWYEMAGLVQDIIETGEWVGHYKSSAAWIKAAAEISGYQSTVLRRMLRVRSFLNRMVVNKKFPLPSGGDMPLASLEILERMFPLSPVRTEELLGRAVNGEITLREVQAEYNELARNNKLTSNPASQFNKDAEAAVSTYIGLFSGKSYNKIVPEFRSSFFVISLIAAKVKHDNLLDAHGFDFEFVPHEAHFKQYKYSVLRRIAFESQFFSRYWIIFSDGTGIEFAEWLTEQLRILNLVNVGVAVLNESRYDKSHQDTWYFPGSIIRPSISSPDNTEFFPSQEEYSPRWRGLLFDDIHKKLRKWNRTE